jgi:hypothetical protein
VLAGELEAGDLKWPLHRAERRNHDLVAGNAAIEKGLPHQRIGRGVLEQAPA